jgi:hypothetical protein
MIVSFCNIRSDIVAGTGLFMEEDLSTEPFV